METLANTASNLILERIEKAPERLWRCQDFGDLSFPSVSQALSRLARKGVLKRVGKGTYYRPTPTPFGPSVPNPKLWQEIRSQGKKVFPAGATGANLLGFSTQNPARPEYATAAGSVPRSMLGSGSILFTRRPSAWEGLEETEGSLLDFLRKRGETSELSENDTVLRLLELLRVPGRWDRLASVAGTEPPRVRAMLGAAGQELGVRPAKLKGLREAINPLSSFDFGKLAKLKFAADWQAVEEA